LCGRIAMLKQGRIVALDTTRNLLARFSGHALTLRLPIRCAMPAGLLARVASRGGGWWFFPSTASTRSSRCLPDARRRVARSRIWIGKPDLEDVFVRVMQGRGDQGRRAAMTAVFHAAVQGSAALLEGRFQTVAAPVLTALLYLLIFSHVLEAHVRINGVPTRPS
jgi:hypothetical protein